jgi:hypothetical protein
MPMDREHHGEQRHSDPNRPIRIFLTRPEEMFVGPAVTDLPSDEGVQDWDEAGRWLGESGCERAMRMLADRPEAASMLIRGPWESATTAADLQARLRAWCDARILRSTQQIRLTRRMGLRTLVWSLLMLGLALTLSWGLQAEAVLGPPGPLRMVLAEALVIAGWVMMWRPVELLFCEPMTPAYERRLLRTLRDLPMSVERA